MFLPVLLLALFAGVVRISAQGPTTTVEPGPGGVGTVETTRDPNGDVISQRTFDPDGHLRDEVKYERDPKAHKVTKKTHTVYYPDGKTPQSISEHEYNEQGTETQWSTDTYDEHGNHTGGYIH